MVFQEMQKNIQVYGGKLWKLGSKLGLNARNIAEIHEFLFLKNERIVL